MAKKKHLRAAGDQEELALDPVNYIGLAVAMAMILAGFFTLSKGSMTAAPILLVLGYCVVLPIAIMIKNKPKSTDAGASGE